MVAVAVAVEVVVGVGVVVEVGVGVEVEVVVEVGVGVVVEVAVVNNQHQREVSMAKKKRSRGLQDLVGKAVFVRTVTHYYTGRLTALTADTLVLEDAAWISDTGRFAQALATGTLGEVEPFPGRVYVMRAAVVDACGWMHALPRETKP